jgi:histone H3/H4
MKSKVKEAIAKQGCRSSEDVIEAVNSTVAWYLEQAVKRCKANGRQTVRGYDVCCD